MKSNKGGERQLHPSHASRIFLKLNFVIDKKSNTPLFIHSSSKIANVWSRRMMAMHAETNDDDTFM